LQGILVAERGIRLGNKVSEVLDWLKIGKPEDEILPPEWENPDDLTVVLGVRPDDGFSVEKYAEDPPKAVKPPDPPSLKAKVIPPAKRQKCFKPEKEPGDPALAKEKGEAHYGWLDSMGFYKDECQNGWRVVFRNRRFPGISVHFFPLRTEVRIESKTPMGGWASNVRHTVKGKKVSKNVLVGHINRFVCMMSESKDKE